MSPNLPVTLSCSGRVAPVITAAGRSRPSGCAGGNQIAHLLAASAEDERITSFEANDEMTLPCELDETRGDLRLPRAAPARALAHVLEARIRPAQGQGFGAYQRVVEHMVRVRQKLSAADRDQVGIARSGADERDAPPCAQIRARDRGRRVLRAGDVAAAEHLADVRSDQPLVDLRLLPNRRTPLAQLTPRAADQRRERSPFATQP